MRACRTVIGPVAARRAGPCCPLAHHVRQHHLRWAHDYAAADSAATVRSQEILTISRSAGRTNGEGDDHSDRAGPH